MIKTKEQIDEEKIDEWFVDLVLDITKILKNEGVRTPIRMRVRRRIEVLEKSLQLYRYEASRK